VSAFELDAFGVSNQRPCQPGARDGEVAKLTPFLWKIHLRATRIVGSAEARFDIAPVAPKKHLAFPGAGKFGDRRGDRWRRGES
jgi:hypothetical protein